MKPRFIRVHSNRKDWMLFKSREWCYRLISTPVTTYRSNAISWIDLENTSWSQSMQIARRETICSWKMKMKIETKVFWLWPKWHQVGYYCSFRFNEQRSERERRAIWRAIIIYSKYASSFFFISVFLGTVWEAIESIVEIIVHVWAPHRDTTTIFRNLDDCVGPFDDENSTSEHRNSRQLFLKRIDSWYSRMQTVRYLHSRGRRMQRL